MSGRGKRAMVVIRANSAPACYEIRQAQLWRARDMIHGFIHVVNATVNVYALCIRTIGACDVSDIVLVVYEHFLPPDSA